MSNNFSIIIPNLNGATYLATCLPALSRSLKNITFEIILVDNGSTDNSLKVAKKIFPQIKIIKNKFNNGFAPAINQGMAISKYDWVVLLNNDLVIESNWFDLIIQQINKNNKYAVYSGTVLTKDGTHYESIGLKFDYRGKCQNINNGLPYLEIAHLKLGTAPIWGCSAALAIYNKPILSKIGGFDNDFFAYEEDVDVSLRLHLLGHQTLFVPAAISYHLGGGTSSKMNNFRQIMDTKNWFYIIIKDYPLKLILQNLFPIIIERLRNLSGLIKATPFHKLPLALIKSYGQVLIYLPRMIKKRYQFQKLINQ